MHTASVHTDLLSDTVVQRAVVTPYEPSQLVYHVNPALRQQQQAGVEPQVCQV
jgi:hypothetical protein